MLSKKSRNIKSFIAMDVLEASQVLTRQGHDIISFSLGEPDFDAPTEAKQACIRAIRTNQTKYTHSQGMPELRAAIVKDYKKKYGVFVDPEQVIVTPGTSPAFFLIFSVILVIVSDSTLLTETISVWPVFSLETMIIAG